MFGHTHLDNTQIMRGVKNKSEITGIVYILPQLGIFRQSNPSYRIFDLQVDNYAIVDYHQYRMYVEEANKLDNAVWRLAYTFKFLYGVQSMDYQSIATAVERIKV